MRGHVTIQVYSSGRFKARWAKRLQENIGNGVCPTFYPFCHWLHHISTVKQHLPLEVVQSKHELASLDYEEVTAHSKVHHLSDRGLNDLDIHSWKNLSCARLKWKRVKGQCTSQEHGQTQSTVWGEQHNSYMLLLTALATAPQWKSKRRVRDEGESSSEDYWKSECACLLVHCLWGRGSWCSAVTEHWLTLWILNYQCLPSNWTRTVSESQMEFEKTSPYYYQQKLNLTTKFPWLATTLFIL